jgi:hypothetical protein
MTMVFRQIAGLCLMGLLAVGVVMLMTAEGRSGLRAQQAQAADLLVNETRLLERLTLLKSSEATGGNLPDDMIWKADSRAEIEIAFQDRLVNAAQAAGMRVMSFSPVAGAAASPLPTMGFDLEMEGGHAEFAAFLAAVEAERPGLAYSSLWVRQQYNGMETPKAMVNVRIGLWAFVDLPEGAASP